ncbi:ArsR/SmtB family transcription factor [Paenibacillus sp. GCM10027627]|uniref:ArsR/SmtB family transcription factor n=1 Tax=unclassified Paenibacillus TaxID=185978 RepID=UPI0036338108
MRSDDRLNDIFYALSDSTRREIVHLLAHGERTVTELAHPFDISLAAVSKHVKVLETAGLLQRTIQGRTHYCRLNASTMETATQWLNLYERYWSVRFDAFEAKLSEPE